MRAFDTKSWAALTILAWLQNLANAQYEELEHYRAAGRSFHAALILTIKLNSVTPNKPAMKKFIILLLIIAGFTASQAMAGTGVISGKVTFLYNGVKADSLHFPASTATTGTFPGYVNVSIFPALASGQVAGGPKVILPASGTPLAYGSLDATGSFNFSFSNLSDTSKIYAVVPSYTNPINNKFVLLGYYSLIAYGDGTPITLNAPSGTDTVSNVNITVDLNLATASLIAAQDTTTNKTTFSQASFAGAITVQSGLANFPTGNISSGNYLAIVGYLSTNVSGIPDLFVQLQKPAVGNVVAFNADSLTAGFGTYKNIELAICNGYSIIDSITSLTKYYTGSTPTTGTTFTLSSSSNIVWWFADATLPNLTLPVELTSFGGKAVPNGVLLSWQTATEKNNSGFEIDRSTDNATFSKIGFVKGNGTTTQSQSYSFTDNMASGNVYYRLKQIDYDGKATNSKMVEVKAGTPVSYTLSQNYPNPFNPSTTITYALPQAGQVTLKVYDLLGREVKTLTNALQAAGEHAVVLDASSFASGIYFYRLQAGNFTATKKMMLVK
jgi:phage baseplate assembly protein gpV